MTIIFIYDQNLSLTMKWIIINLQYKEKHTETWTIIRSLHSDQKIEVHIEAHTGINWFTTTSSISDFVPMLFPRQNIIIFKEKRSIWLYFLALMR